ncbi:sugar transferase [Candidatus Chloroploca sp. M-50]|uniref:Sugar transferase n=1 Tax=Candidatus Chloroploca mongolica TaxID=2528176 RepID=A0ABS4D785_9CHLR|nr:sugar transferase [Candidatus Chloroploca mongolica]MBP1465297.1 sugar transferase [Candidatus Chloroploca mongolica]
MDQSIRHPTGPTLVVETEQKSIRRSRHFTALGMLLWDLALILTSVVFAYWLRYTANWPEPFDRIVSEVATQNQVEFEAFLPIFLPMMVLLAFQFGRRGLYQLSPRLSLLDQIGIIVSSTLTVIAFLIVVVFLYKPFYYSRLIFAFTGATIILLLSVWRVIRTGVQHWQWSRGIGQERVLVVGGSGLGQDVMNGIVSSPGLGYALAGYLNDRPVVENGRATRVYRHLGDFDDLEQAIRASNSQQVILALPFWEQGRLPEFVMICERLGVEYLLAPDFYQLSFDRVDLHQLSGVPLLRPKEIRLQGINLTIKRVMDVALVLALAPVILMIGALVALLVRLDSHGPVIFRQQRVGRGGTIFNCYKFRTMVPDAEARKAELAHHNDADGPLFKMRDDPRITRIGHFLRRSSLDELPQLWNVLRGEMSLIGPRPALPDEVARYEPWHRRRLEVMPGCAGIVQALGRSDMSFDEQVRLDIYYAENWSVSMDIRIMLMVIPAVIGGRGAY